MFHLHFIAESGIGSKQNLALFINTVMHAWQFGWKSNLVAASGVRMKQAGTGFWPVWKKFQSGLWKKCVLNCILKIWAIVCSRKKNCIAKELQLLNHVIVISSVKKVRDNYIFIHSRISFGQPGAHTTIILKANVTGTTNSTILLDSTFLCCLSHCIQSGCVCVCVWHHFGLSIRQSWKAINEPLWQPL